MLKRVFITVGEVSGDKIAAGLIRALRRLDPSIAIEGLGGPEMAAAGATIFRDMTAKAAMTFHAAARAREVLRLLRWADGYYRNVTPALHISVDSSGMNLPFAKVAKRAGVPVLYYVAPQTWASREGRVRKIARCVDKLACIFPFEEMYFRSRGVDAAFVGHPLFDLLPPDRYERDRGPRYPDCPPVVGIVPGSRRAEVRENLPHLLEVMTEIRGAFPDASFLIPTTPSVHSLVTEMAADAKGVEIRQDAFDELIPRCDLCLTKSGTSTVHVAAWGVPMIVVYRINPILWHGVGRWLVKTRKIAMVNILAGQVDLVPEFIPWYGSSHPVAECALDLLRSPQKLAEQRQALRKLIEPLDRPGAAENAARLALELIRGEGEGSER